MARLFARHPDAVSRTLDFAARCTFDLSELRYQYPDEADEPGHTPQQALERLTWAGIPARYPDGLPDAVDRQLRHELRLIAQLDYAPYFLTVHSIVRYARSKGILCQGRGSAANSAVCYVLGITSIDPTRSGLLFERFVSAERQEPPDIDVDFEAERREEVIQWVYDHYGRDRAALCCTVMRFRARGAVRDVGKVMGLPEDITGALASQVWGWSEDGVEEQHAKELGLNLEDRRLRLTLDLARELIGFPRQLGTHPGGFVLTQDRLDDLVPIEPAAMADRAVVEWDKDDIDALRFMKVDVLGLGMLGCLRRGFQLLGAHKGLALDMATVPPEDPATYAMIRKADTLGTFQIESRAQMAMLPRHKPRTFYDLVIQVAVVRPGPIQGDMVHPYLRRREGKEAMDYPTPELERVLGKTLGVPLFQEQAMQVAIVCAGFTPGEADQLRRAMATFKFTGGVSHFKDKLISGMVANGYDPAFAERTFSQIEGFGSYGFPESHAASFALIAYASAWMKCHHPDAFCAALLNSQPMGFYAPAQVVRDAAEHGVEIRPVDVNRSEWDCTLEEDAETLPLPGGGRGPGEAWEGEGSPRPEGLRRGKQPSPQPSPWKGEREGVFFSLSRLRERAGVRAPRPPPTGTAVRLGLRVAAGLNAVHGMQLAAQRGARPYASVQDLHRRTGLPVAALERLAEADAFGSLGLARREALWAIRGLSDQALPLFAAVSTDREPAVPLPAMPEGRQVVEDYRSTGLSLRRHPVSFLRDELRGQGMIPCADLEHARNGRRVAVAGLVLVRQKPGSAKGVMFITLEDETAIANLVVWPSLFEQQRRLVLSAGMMGCQGRVQSESGVVHLVAERLSDLTPMLRGVAQRDAPFPLRTGRGDEAKHGGSPDQRDGLADRRVRDIYIPDLRLGSGIRVPTRDFR